jgi:hypothetical protein
MAANKSWRVANAVVFLCGVYACLYPLRDAKVVWPPDVLWHSLRNPQRLEFGGGLALIVVTIVLSVIRAPRRS